MAREAGSFEREVFTISRDLAKANTPKAHRERTCERF
jgi:hypothetical protein